MDRWGYIDWWKKHERRRAHLVPGRVEACIVAAVIVSLFGGRLLHCAIEPGPLGSCLQSGMPRVLAISLHSAALLLGIWAGPRIGLRLDSKELGWLCGAMIVVALSGSLALLGFQFRV